jgi:hypothetical protein
MVKKIITLEQSKYEMKKKIDDVWSEVMVTYGNVKTNVKMKTEDYEKMSNYKKPEPPKYRTSCSY